jgi:hypothetical protein
MAKLRFVVVTKIWHNDQREEEHTVLGGEGRLLRAIRFDAGTATPVEYVVDTLPYDREGPKLELATYEIVCLNGCRIVEDRATRATLVESFRGVSNFQVWCHPGGGEHTVAQAIEVLGPLAECLPTPNTYSHNNTLPMARAIAAALEATDRTQFDTALGRFEEALCMKVMSKLHHAVAGHPFGSVDQDLQRLWALASDKPVHLDEFKKAWAELSQIYTDEKWAGRFEVVSNAIDRELPGLAPSWSQTLQPLQDKCLRLLRFIDTGDSGAALDFAMSSSENPVSQWMKKADELLETWFSSEGVN